jgi:hypothetical protein
MVAVPIFLYLGYDKCHMGPGLAGPQCSQRHCYLIRLPEENYLHEQLSIGAFDVRNTTLGLRDCYLTMSLFGTLSGRFKAVERVRRNKIC